MSLLITVLLIPCIIAIFILFILSHMPNCVNYVIGRLPSWVFSTSLHIIVYILIGGVTGHLIALAIDPILFLMHYFFYKDYARRSTEAWASRNHARILRLFSPFIFIFNKVSR